jgi:hypothetical protein
MRALAAPGSAQAAWPQRGLATRVPAILPFLRWMRHLAEMVAAMVIGMEILFGLYDATARAVGFPDPMLQLPIASTLVMAAAMILPMWLWMGYRDHSRQARFEMSAAMALPLVVLLPATVLGVAAESDLGSSYHLAMYVGMLGVMVWRRADYSSSHAGHGHLASGSSRPHGAT